MIHKKTIKHIHKLQQKKYRKEFNEYIIEGVKGVTEALQSDTEVLLVLMTGTSRDDEGFSYIVSLCSDQDIPLEFIGRKEIGDIKTTDTFPGVLAVVSTKEYGPEDVLSDGPVICLNGVKDPGNLGTIIRTADWFGIQNILLSEDSVDPYNPKVVRSTMGSIFRVKIHTTKNIASLLQKAKETYALVGLSMEGEPIGSMKAKKETIYVFGSESHGISSDLEELLDHRYTISGDGGAESLNLAVSAGIVMSRI